MGIGNVGKREKVEFMFMSATVSELNFSDSPNSVKTKK